MINYKNKIGGSRMALDTKVSILNINDILPNRFQPRIKFEEEKINELANSIRKYGVIQPIIVRNIGDKYEIIAGERRYKASVVAGLKEIPAIINNLDDEDSSEIALIENVQRENLTPIEEAISIKKILDMGGKKQEEVAEKLGMSQPSIANKLRLLNLDESVQEALLEKKISERHARSLLKIADKQKQKEMLDRIIKERLTVKRLDEEIQKVGKEKKETIKIPSFLPEIEEKENTNKETLEQDELKVLDIINEYYEKKNKKEEKNMNSNDPMNQFIKPTVPVENTLGQGDPNINIISPEPNQNVRNIQGGISTPVNPAMKPQEHIIESTVVGENSQNWINSQMGNTSNIPSPEPNQNINNIKEKTPMNVENAFASEIQMINPTVPIENIQPQINKNTMGNPLAQESTTSPAPEGRFFSVLPGKADMPSQKPEAPALSNANPVSTPISDTSIFESTPQMQSHQIPPTIPSPVQPNPAMQPQETEGDTDEGDGDLTLPLSALLEKDNFLNSLKETAEKPLVSEQIVSSEENINQIEENKAINKPTSTVPLQRENPIPSTVSPLSFQMREAINITRDTVDKIESLGVQVDTEEIDLPDCYEIIVRFIKEP